MLKSRPGRCCDVRAVVVLPLLLAGLGGCLGAGGPDAAAALDLAPGTGAVRGLVVDEAIRPVAGANVTLSGGGLDRTALTDEGGFYQFDDVAPGVHVLLVQGPRHAAIQGTVDVRAGEVSTSRTMVPTLVTQEPYHETLKFDGYIQCGYSVSGFLSSICVNDYTHFVGPYTCPDCEHLVDSRSHDFAVGAGWKTMVYEMTWEPSAQGTSPEMRLIVSHFPRPASHWYCSSSGPDPLAMRMDVGIACEDQQDEPVLVPPEGLPNMHMFAATNAPDGQPVSATLSQPFSVFMNFFYHAPAPQGWSFVHGDPFPF